MLFKFTKSGEKVFDLASDMATLLGHNYIGSEHILYGLAKENEGLAHRVLESQGIFADIVLKKIENIIGKGSLNLNSSIRIYFKSKEDY